MLRNYTAYFEVKLWYDGHEVNEAGFYPANSFGEAVDYLEEFYGDELMAIEHLELLDYSLVTMRPEEAAGIAARHQGGTINGF